MVFQVNGLPDNRAYAERNPFEDEDVPEAPLPSVGELTDLAAMAQRQLDAMEKVTLAQAALNNAEKELKLAEETLATAMTTAGVSFFGLPNGGRVDVEYQVHAAVPVDAPPVLRQRAFAWLTSIGAEPLIKHDVAIQFDKGEASLAVKLVESLKKHFKDHKITDREQVHWATLSKLVKGRLLRGLEVPMDLLGVSAKNVAVISGVKPKEE